MKLSPQQNQNKKRVSIKSSYLNSPTNIRRTKLKLVLFLSILDRNLGNIFGICGSEHLNSSKSIRIWLGWDTVVREAIARKGKKILGEFVSEKNSYPFRKVIV